MLRPPPQPQVEALPYSSTNLINTPKKTFNIDTAFSRRDQAVSSYHPIISKQIRVGIQQQQSALPHTYKSSQFIILFPFIIFSVLRQLHVIYLILISGFLIVKYCDNQWSVLLMQLCLTLGYICIQLISRYHTFKSYTQQHYYNDASYYCWNRQIKTWQPIQQQYLKVGQIIKIKKKNNNSNNMQQSQIDQNLKIRVPVNLLPMKVLSNQKQVSIQTFDIDKQQASININILKPFQQYFLSTKTEITYVKPKIIDQCLIQYTFSNPISESFQACVSFFSGSIQKQVCNSDAIPRGAYFLNQQQLVGVVLLNLQQKNMNHLKHILGSRNSIATLLQKHLISIMACNIIISLLLLALNAIVTSIQTGTIFQNQYHCYVFNTFSLLSYSMNVVMYMILGIHQIIDSFLIKKNCNVHMNNCIKSVDQFGVADTFIMDQFSFVKKNILQVSSIQINQQQQTNLFNQEVVLMIIQKSLEFQNKFQNQWLSLTHYYRVKYGRFNSKKKDMFYIKDQKIDMSGSITVVVCFQDIKNRQFIVRFNQKVIFYVLETMTIQMQIKLSEKIAQGKQNGELMLMVEIMQLKNQEEISISAAMYQFQFKFLSLIKLKFLPHSRAVDFLRYLKNKFKIIIMASSTFQYFQNILVCSGLKDQNDYLMVFDQTEENDFQKDLAQKIDEYKKSLFKTQGKGQQKWRRGSYAFSDQHLAFSSQKSHSGMRKTYGFSNIIAQSKSGDLILAIHSSLIVYLGRPSIKQMIKEISKFSTYIIFYNCSQFQKQLCSASVFKIFPQHIFLSNFAIDSNIFRLSNLSVCISKHSASRYTTAIASSYQSLQKFISKQCVTSIQLTTIIIKTHIFKNQCLIWSILTASLLVYRMHYTFYDNFYSTYIMYFYNLFFTILPLFYYLIARPGLVGDIMVDDYKDYKLRYEHIKGIFSGVLITFVSFALIPEAQITMIYVAVMVNCSLMANFYHLVIDDSANKGWQIWIITIQLVLSISTYFITIYIQNTYQMFTIFQGLYPDPLYEALYFCTIFIINPWLIFMLFFFISFHKSILVKDRRLQKKQLQDEQVKISIKKQRILGRVSKSGGKQMRFRRVDGRSQIY